MKLLIVDDEQFIREGLKNCINWAANGITQVETARSGLEALECFDRDYYDILIVDVQMPKMSGLELAEKIQVISPYTKIIILSGYAEFEYAKKAVELNVLSYLLKPVNIDELERLIDKISKEEGSHASGAVVEKAKDYIKQHYRGQLSIQNVADHVERNADYLSNLFRKKEGVTFTEYLNSLRIKKAQQLLLNTSQYTYEISESVGYSDYRYFTQVFKKITGCSPSEYRKQE